MPGLNGEQKALGQAKYSGIQALYNGVAGEMMNDKSVKFSSLFLFFLFFSFFFSGGGGKGRETEMLLLRAHVPRRPFCVGFFWVQIYQNHGFWDACARRLCFPFQFNSTSLP